MNPADPTPNSTLPEKVVEKPMEGPIEAEKDIVSWSAPSRPFKRRNREFYVTTIIMALIVGLILFFTEGFMPVILLISLIFLYYVLSTVEPENIEYKITDRGVYIAGRKTELANFKRFWFSQRHNSLLLIMETYSLPGRLEYVLDPAKKEEIKKALSKYLPEEETPPSTIDKATGWFANKLPGSRQ